MEYFVQFVIENWYWWLLLVLLFIALLLQEASGKVGGLVCLSAEDAVRRINRDHAKIIDIRDNKSFAAGHILDAIHVLPSDLDVKLKKLKKHKDKPLIIVCPQGQQSPKFANRLKKEGFTQLFGIKGGIAAWRDAGLPLTRQS